MNTSGKITEFLLWLLLTAGIVMVSLTPSPVIPESIILSSDKVSHFLAYMVLAGWTFLASGTFIPKGEKKDLKRWIFAVLYGTVLGGAMELLQPYFGRTMSFMDFVADIAGSIVGATLGILVLRTYLSLFVTRPDSDSK